MSPLALLSTKFVEPLKGVRDTDSFFLPHLLFIYLKLFYKIQNHAFPIKISLYLGDQLYYILQFEYPAQNNPQFTSSYRNPALAAL
jgi:F0F1-type ATP synthase assembly protein I